MDDLTSTTGALGLAAVVVALAALTVGIVALVRLRRLRADQQLVLGDTGSADVVAHAAGLSREFRALHAYVEDMATHLTGRLDTVETRLDGAIAHTSLVRYDAYNEMSGRQSTTLALLDDRRNGIVISTIHHRDTARMYVKRVVDGAGELQLSPEEDEAIRLALSTELPAPSTPES
ncbi:MAG: hypothetical protein JWO02_1488 [Solirubrobacterales bacterium]|nr:hypothetical protein [Solirubrobacterales bacterium]